MSLHIETHRRTQRPRTSGWHRRDVAESPQQSREHLGAVREQQVDPLGQEAHGIRVEATRIEEDVACELVISSHSRLERRIPRRSAVVGLAEQELPQNPQRVRPEGVFCERRPLRRVRPNLLQELETRPVSREVVFELDAIGAFVQPERKLGWALREGRRVGRFKVRQGEAALEGCFPLREAHHESLNVGAILRPVFPKPVPR